jgi:hypothetical protein
MKQQKWLETARTARRLLDSADGDGPSPARGPGPNKPSAPKGRLARIHAIAQDIGLTGPTLRNYLLAFEAMRVIEDLRIVEILSGHTAAAVLAFCRWADRDPSAAYSFLVANPNAPLAKMLAAERAHRTGSQAPRKARPELDASVIARIAFGPALRSALDPHTEARLGRSLRLQEIVPADYRFAGLDLLVTASDHADPTDTQHVVAGAIRLPQWAILDDYAKRAKDIWWRAASASAPCPIVLVVFPGPAARRRFLGALPQSAEATKSVFSGLSRSPLAGSGAGARPLYFRCGPNLGLIVITSVLTLARDLSA